MTQLRQNYQEFIKLDTVVVVVGPEDATSFQKYFNENQLPFIGLPDPQHSVLKLYGQEVSIFKLGRMPAQVLIDKNGTARFVHYGKNMSDIPSSEELLKLLADLNFNANNEKASQ